MNTVPKNISEQNPESYSPKDKPVILSMAEIFSEQFRAISQIKAFENNFEIFVMPAVRVIGKELIVAYKKKSPVPAFVDKFIVSDEWKTFENLPKIVSDSSFGWTCDYVPETDSFSYLVSTLTPAGTPVPDGFVYRDLQPTLVAKGLYGDSIAHIIKEMKKLGYRTNWDSPTCDWNAELYLREEELNPPVKDCKEECHWLVPCKKEELK